MPHTYKFADPTHETVERVTDGARFSWPRDVNPGNIEWHGKGSMRDLVAQWLADNGPRRTEPYQFKVEGKALAVLSAALGENDARRAIEVLHEAHLCVVDLPTPCR
jgi:hypothetical protein